MITGVADDDVFEEVSVRHGVKLRSFEFRTEEEGWRRWREEKRVKRKSKYKQKLLLLLSVSLFQRGKYVSISTFSLGSFFLSLFFLSKNHWKCNYYLVSPQHSRLGPSRPTGIYFHCSKIFYVVDNNKNRSKFIIHINNIFFNLVFFL